MVEIRQTATFTKWIKGLADRRAKLVIAKRIDRLAYGHMGDKGSQARDIIRANALVNEL